MLFITIPLGIISLIMIFIVPPLGIALLVVTALIVVANNNRNKRSLEADRHQELLDAARNR